MACAIPGGSPLLGAAPHHGLRRYHGYDYSRGGSLFVSLVLSDRSRHLFGEIDQGRLVRSPAGEIALQALAEARAKYPQFTVRSFALMPEHCHMRFTFPAGLGNALRLAGAFVGFFKQLSQWRIAGRSPKIWAAGYHDLVSTSERMNRCIDAYVGNNPLKWWLMKCDRSLMRVIEPLVAPGLTDDVWRAVGNTELLKSAKIVSMRITRQLPPAMIDQVVETCLKGLEKGYVYASTFYSPGERALMKALAAVGAPMIRLIPTFVDYGYRPVGDEPQLFANRQLLLLSRMADPQADASRPELLDLNAVAAGLANASPGGKGVYCQMRQPHKGAAARLEWAIV